MTEENLFETKDRQLTFELESGEKIFQQAYDNYDNDQIRMLYDLYNESNVDYSLKLYPGLEIDGEIVGETNLDYLVDVGYKDYIRIEKRNEENYSLHRYANEEGDIEYGTKVTVMVTDVKENPYILKGSFAAISKRDAHEDLIKDKRKVISARVLKWSPAGFNLDLLYDCFKIPAFMPNTLAGVNKLTGEQSQEMVGTTIEVMIESYVQGKGTFIASRKKFLKTLVMKETRNLEITKEDGTPVTYTGEITGTIDFGIFVQFNGCLTCMIHKDNLDDETRSDLKNGIIKAGQTIDFYIKEVVDTKIIATKVWRETLWDTIKQGDKFENEIKEFKKFGALVRLDEETVGLIHSSELDKSGIKYKAGDIVKVKVLSVNRMERKINLILDLK